MVKIQVIEYWTDRKDPLSITYDKMTDALKRILEIYSWKDVSKKRDELLPKAELIITFKEE